MIEPMGAEFKLAIRVYIEDTDAGGIVYYVNYLKFMERARTEFMRQLGFGKAALGGAQERAEKTAEDSGAIFVVSDVQAKYRSPARLDDQLTVSAKLIELRKASLVFEQKIWRDEQLLCEGEVKVACANAKTLRATRVPAELYKVLSRLK
ncbi:tol-pal system-associated acyl-CoA thioesterase [Spongiibacter sp. KMU-158]|uniref:Tol-pal system-associated acyl-CoA thioesterase n=1 Tax=Spongiibacter pelagi TaxID=2760804 RepID=A0A927C1Y7_9GAMM|nr:tol-pal system-associated acyl-CoA thioesterase [Spongiibacter pelagi]MBD2859800.1 tol-pal system-associated acyl-CoA thioesterase [Spongiibacter pelagi]